MIERRHKIKYSFFVPFEPSLQTRWQFVLWTRTSVGSIISCFFIKKNLKWINVIFYYWVSWESHLHLVEASVPSSVFVHLSAGNIGRAGKARVVGSDPCRCDTRMGVRSPCPSSPQCNSLQRPRCMSSRKCHNGLGQHLLASMLETRAVNRARY
jgi:hypothetical protein